MTDENRNSRLDWIHFNRKLAGIAIASGLAILLSFYLTQIEFFPFFGLFIYCFSFIYGVAAILYLTYIALQDKSLRRKSITTILLILFSFSLGYICMNIGFQLFIQLSD